MNTLRRLLAGLATPFGAVCFAALLLYPIYKHLYLGFAFILLGGLPALAPVFMPGPTLRVAKRLASLSDRKWLVRITALAALLRLPLILFPPPPIGDFLFYLEHAVSIANGAGYGEAINYPPGQSGWLSIWIRPGGSDLHYLVLIQSVVSLATIWVIYAGFRPYSRRAAMWASAIVAVYPSIVVWTGVMGHETLVMLLESILFWLTGKAARTQRNAWQWWILLGLTAGVTALVRPTFVLTPVLVAGCLALSSYKPLRAFTAGAVITICMLLAIAPWTWRNYRMFHGFALISTNLGSTLLSSNHPQSDGIYMPTEQFAPGLDPIEGGKLEQKMAIAAMKADPVRIAKLSFKRIVYMWGAETSIPDEAYGADPAFGQSVRQIIRALVQLFWVWFVVACLLGTPYFRRSWTFREAPVLWAISWLVAISCLHALIEPQARHHMALLPLLAGVYLPSYGMWIAGKSEQIAPGQNI